MERAPVNFRAFLLIATAVVGAVFCAYMYAVNAVAGIILGVLLVVALAIATVVVAFLFVKKRVKLRVAAACGLAFVLGLSAFAFGAAQARKWRDGLDMGGYRYVSGRVCAVDTSTGEYRLYLEKLRLDGERADGVMCVKLNAADENYGEFVACGDTVSFPSYVIAGKLVDGYSVDGTAYRTDTRYYAAVRADELKIDFGEPNATERFLSALKALFIDNMGDRYGNIAFSMVSGDKHTLATDVKDYYSAAGLGHIMAVSGLHIGFMAMLLDFLLKKLGKRIRFPIILCVLVAYAALADFSPSVVRAVIMTVVAMSSLFVGGRRDILSSLLCALSLILAVKPFYLFEVGFLLSFGAIFGIAVFGNSIARFFVRHGAHRKVAQSIGTAVSVSIGITPAEIYFFNALPVLTVLVNIAVIPYVAVVFIAIVCMTVVAAMGLGGALAACKYMLIPLDMIAQGMAFSPLVSLTVFSTAAVFLSYPIMFCASEFFMMPKGKLAVIAYSAAACVALCAVGAPRVDNTLTVVPDAETTSIVCIDGKAYVVGYMGDEYAVRGALKKLRRKRVDGMYLLDADDGAAERIIELSRTVDIGTVYCMSPENGVRLIENGIDFRLYDGSGAFSVEYDGGAVLGYSYNDVLFAVDNANERAFSAYGHVRVRSVENAPKGVIYYCNYGANGQIGVYTTASGIYTVDL